MENLITPIQGKGEKIVCEKCSCEKFQLVFMLEKYNKLLIGADKDQISPLQVFACLECGHVNEYFLPKE
jgi:uncharacterized Zn finger protein